MSAKINLGIVGAVGRGGNFRLACEAGGVFHIHAICDTNTDQLEKTRQLFGASEAYADFDQMLEKSDLQAVLIGTPMHFHARQAIAALARGIHVMSEVTAGVSIEECRALVATAKSSRAIYMMSENYCYIRSNVLIREMVRRGLFGETYYGEGEYLHELKELNEVTRWRRKWQTGINGVTYGTHSLGPILQWMPGDRVTSVCCAGTGHHYRDSRGDSYEAEDSSVMLCKMGKGGLVKIRVDMLSDRPEGAMNYQLQGTDGAYESARAGSESGRIWLRKKSKEITWMPLADLDEEFLPAWYRAGLEEASKAGHGGGDYFVVTDFADAITGKKQCPIGIHEAMNMTLPGLVSQQSIREGGTWLTVPDSRTW